MAYTAIEIIVMIFLLLSIVKIIYLLVKPTAWMAFAKKVYAKPKLLKAGAIILAIIVFYFLIQVIGIVEIFAVMTFTALIFVIGLADMGKKLIKEVKIKTLWHDYWLYTLIWLALMIWAAIALFA
jgi:hypothetical protein